MALLNFHQITSNIGTSGQPSKYDFGGFADSCVTTVVNLAMHDSENALDNEGSVVAALGMAYIHFPIPFEAPSAGQLRKFIALMEALEGEKVHVHCAVNARVSAFMFKYLTLTKGVEEAEATTPLLNRWKQQMDETWQRFLQIDQEELSRMR